MNNYKFGNYICKKREDKGYDDFDEHYVYVCENPEGSLGDIF